MVGDEIQVIRCNFEQERHGEYEMTPNYSNWRKYGIVGPIVHMRIADMQNDIDLTREILIKIREKDDLKPTPVQVPDYEPVLVMRHVKRLYDDGMVEGRVSEAIGMEAPMVFVTDMTTAGHNFLAALEDEKIWNKVKSALSPAQLAALSMKQIATLAGELAMKHARDLLNL